jgi:hypothetical protein
MQSQLEKMIQSIRNHQTLAWYKVRVVQFHKRGIPHAHIMFFMPERTAQGPDYPLYANIKEPVPPNVRHVPVTVGRYLSPNEAHWRIAHFCIPDRSMIHTCSTKRCASESRVCRYGFPKRTLEHKHHHNEPLTMENSLQARDGNPTAHSLYGISVRGFENW